MSDRTGDSTSESTDGPILDDAIFTGTDDTDDTDDTDETTATDGGNESASTSPAAAAADEIDVAARDIAADVVDALDKPHRRALAIGFVPVALAFILGDPRLFAASMALTIAALGLRKLENKALRVIVQNPAFLLVGQLAAVVIGGAATALLDAVGITIDAAAYLPL